MGILAAKLVGAEDHGSNSPTFRLPDHDLSRRWGGGNGKGTGTFSSPVPQQYSLLHSLGDYE